MKDFEQIKTEFINQLGKYSHQIGAVPIYSSRLILECPRIFLYRRSYTQDLHIFYPGSSFIIYLLPRIFLYRRSSIQNPPLPYIFYPGSSFIQDFLSKIFLYRRSSIQGLLLLEICYSGSSFSELCYSRSSFSEIFYPGFSFIVDSRIFLYRRTQDFPLSKNFYPGSSLS